ncbi:MAG: hypothetical protein ACE5ES_01515 [Candidatus Nanoarchaeia archaeon]
MILKRITLNNIRSYKDQEISFPEGSTLLSGDIGSGKTSILLGIEFALFGLQPGQRGSSLLRNGEKIGGIVMEFEVDGKEVRVERTLKRGKTISQDYCSITVDNEKNEISVTELKNFVLELLNYPREFSKKQNILYKFTVYTPQEEMKQIILQDPETRVNTLRHVFGIDKYKKIIENISIIASKLREEVRIMEGATLNLEQDKSDLLIKEEDLETKQKNLSSIENEHLLKITTRKKIQEEQQLILERIEEKRKLEQEVEKKKIMITNKHENMNNNKKLIEQIEFQIAEIEKLKFNPDEIQKLEQELSISKKHLRGFNEKNLNITSQISSIEVKNQENLILKQKLSEIEICPTCLQDIDPVYRSNVLNKIHSETFENSKKLEDLESQKKIILEEITKINNEITSTEKKIQDLNLLKIKIQGSEEKRARILDLNKNNKELEEDMNSLNNNIDSLKNSILELTKFDNIFQEKQSQLEFALNEERVAEIRVAELKKEIDVFSKQIEELKEKISETEKIKERLNYVTGLESWLTKKFVPVISFVEKNVMLKLKLEFSKLFSNWFSMLVSDTFHVRLDDNFTPIIEQQDYEIDYAYLSGGERTAIALAYRLALNQVINSLLSKIKTHDIVILDEPTDGFSEQQLDKMRDVLMQLDIGQLIIVSHEQKMEDFVENVIKFKKESGISGIEV